MVFSSFRMNMIGPDGIFQGFLKTRHRPLIENHQEKQGQSGQSCWIFESLNSNFWCSEFQHLREVLRAKLQVKMHLGNILPQAGQLPWDDRPAQSRWQFPALTGPFAAQVLGNLTQWTTDIREAAAPWRSRFRTRNPSWLFSLDLLNNPKNTT